ncbi:MAG: hypothetical protein HUU38_27140 [Anaerolineales bacterium]|nr:hypothetical protein [Anaerolineales bacterium]
MASPYLSRLPPPPSPPGHQWPGYQTTPDQSGSARLNGRRCVDGGLHPPAGTDGMAS